ncbi:hypothetical protein B0H13DRAFT_2301546 [Mycena leptocephala]|nr:hypothetical protein B0H13DRAFT_2301546 [Mycena leptocephala]
MSNVEHLITASKFFVRGVHPHLDIGAAMLYGPEKLWGKPPAADASNLVVIPSTELARQAGCISASIKMFSITPDLLDVIQQFYLEIPSKPSQWTALVTLIRDVATSARTTDTSGMKHELNYCIPASKPSQRRPVPPIPEQESKSDRGLAHPMLRYFIMPWSDRCKLPPLVCTPPSDAQEEEDAIPSDSAESAKELHQLIVENKLKLRAKRFPSCFYVEGSYDPTNKDAGKSCLGLLWVSAVGAGIQSYVRAGKHLRSNEREAVVVWLWIRCNSRIAETAFLAAHTPTSPLGSPLEDVTEYTGSAPAHIVPTHYRWLHTGTKYEKLVGKPRPITIVSLSSLFFSSISRFVFRVAGVRTLHHHSHREAALGKARMGLDGGRPASAACCAREPAVSGIEIPQLG